MSDELDGAVAICPCTGMTVAQVEKAIANGARSTEEIFERAGEVIYCSQCMVEIDDLVFAAASRRANPA